MISASCARRLIRALGSRGEGVCYIESEFIKSIAPVLGALVGGLLTYLGIYSTQRLIRGKEQRQYLLAKLERAYLLTQSLYDGHKSEVSKLKASENITAADWMRRRKHPGEVMNEIKMIVGMYFPALQSALDDVDKYHQAIKESFLKIDQEMQSGSSKWVDRSKVANDMRTKLEYLGNRLTVLKHKIASQAGKL